MPGSGGLQARAENDLGCLLAGLAPGEELEYAAASYMRSAFCRTLSKPPTGGAQLTFQKLQQQANPPSGRGCLALWSRLRLCDT